MGKLVEISNGKWSSIHPTKKVEEVVSGTGGPKSLNINARRNENVRIERENQAFAKRLFDKEGSLSKKKMDEEFYSHKKYMKQIQKVKKKKLLPKLNGRAN